MRATLLPALRPYSGQVVALGLAVLFLVLWACGERSRPDPVEPDVLAHHEPGHDCPPGLAKQGRCPPGSEPPDTIVEPPPDTTTVPPDTTSPPPPPPDTTTPPPPDTVTTPPPPPPVGGLLPAFPGAEGWGALALNDCRSRPLRVHLVTNTNDSGNGSFRAAIDALDSSFYDVVVFRTGGTITSNGTMDLRRSCVYIAGQTAPGDGIMIRSAGGGFNMLRLHNNQDVVIRYLRMRHGVDASMRADGSCGGCGALRLTATGGARRIVIDHVSGSWTLDGTFGVWRTDPSAPHTREITWQRNIASEGFIPHSTGLNIGGRNSTDAFQGVYDISVHHNLFAHNGQRNPALTTSQGSGTSRGTEVVNNVAYNWSSRIGSGDKWGVTDLVNNYWKTGQDWHTNRWWRQRIWRDGDPADPYPFPPSMLIEGTVATGYTGDQWGLIEQWDRLGQTLDPSWRRFTRIAQPPIPVTVTSAMQAYDDVLANVGANARLDCDGSWLPAQDPVDARVIADVRNGTGQRVGSVAEAGGWPTMQPGTPCADTDGDGLPDAWEARYFGCATCATAGSVTTSGYLVVEHYLHGTDPTTGG